MNRIGFALFSLALLLFVVTPPVRATDHRSAGAFLDDGGKKDGDKEKDKDKDKDKGDKKDGDDGDSKFEDPGDEKPKFPEKPVPATFDFKDYRLEMSTEDGRFWKALAISEDDKKNGLVFLMSMKLPKSSDAFDVQIAVTGWTHNLKLTFPDGSAIGAANYKAIAEKEYEADLKSWKEVRDPEKPRARRVSRDISKAYHYAFTGQHPTAGFPLHVEKYFFKWKDKTYAMTILYTTGSVKNEQITKQVDEMLKTLREWKEKRSK